MKNNRYIMALCAAILFSAGTMIGGNIFAKNENDENLAKIAILNYEDQTGSSNYAYMSSSLSDAVNQSMQKNFSFERIQPESAQAAFNKAKEDSANVKEKGADEYNFEVYKRMSKDLKADIVISGYYKFNSVTQKIEIYTRMYYVGSQEFADIPLISNKVDNTIFSATEKTAASIISEIKKMAEKASELSKKSGKEEEKKEGNKIVLTHDLAKKFSRFMDHYNGAVADNKTGFLWEKCEPAPTNKKACRRGLKISNWENAKKFCKSLKIEGRSWDLPTASQLETLINPGQNNPSTFIIFSPYTDGEKFGYWSLTEGFNDAGYFTVSYVDKKTRLVQTKNINNVRCVADVSGFDREKDQKKFLEREEPAIATLFLDAAKWKRILDVSLYIDLGIPMKYRNQAILYAANGGDKNLIDTLVKSGADIFYKGDDGRDALDISRKSKRTATIYAVELYFGNDLVSQAGMGNLEKVKELISRGIDKDKKYNRDENALIASSKNGKLEVVKYLVKEGANLNLKDKKGKTALKWATENGHDKIAELLKTAGAK